MTPKINMTLLAGKKLLVAPLDWGLGHATRCIPIIKHLLDYECKVWLAGEGAQEDLLRKEFPGLPCLPLRGYRINYSPSGITGKLLLQIPKILTAIREEKKWLDEQVNKYEFDAVITDNRYGLYHKKLHSVFITHQLNIKSPLGKWSEFLLQKWNYYFINRFDECWIPDEEGENNLAGELSHPQKFPLIPVKYIGPLSRFTREDDSGKEKTRRETGSHLLVILSGPEPLRSIFENKIIDQLIQYNGTATVIRGLPAARDIIPSTNRIWFYNHLTADLMKEEMEKAEFVISRSGYSTIMDMAAMQKKSILVPTPGQPEQEYLAAYLMKKQLAYCIKQDEFSLDKNLDEARRFAFHFKPGKPL